MLVEVEPLAKANPVLGELDPPNTLFVPTAEAPTANGLAGAASGFAAGGVVEPPNAEANPEAAGAGVLDLAGTPNGFEAVLG